MWAVSEGLQPTSTSVFWAGGNTQHQPAASGTHYGQLAVIMELAFRSSEGNKVTLSFLMIQWFLSPVGKYIGIK